MTLPVAPLALLIALVPAAALLVLGYWRFAVGVALVMLSAAVAATYALHSIRALRESVIVFGIPAVFCVTAIAVVGRKGQLSSASLVIGGVVGLAPLCFLGFYAMLLSACSFGDCL